MIALGPPKAGCHALKHAMELIGAGKVTLTHETKDCNDQTAIILRNPKNILISWTRFTSVRYTKGNLLSAIRGTYADNLKEYMMSFVGLPGYYVRFEDLVFDSQRTLEGMAEHFGLTVPEDAAECVVLQTVTANPDIKLGEPNNLSDFTDPKWLWDDEVQAAWEATGGLEVEAAYG